MNNHKMEILAKKVGKHVDTLYRAKRNGTASKELSKELEKITGIDRRKFMYSEEFGDPWTETLANIKIQELEKQSEAA